FSVPYPLFLTKMLIRSGLAGYLPSVRGLAGAAFLRHLSDRILCSPRADLADWAEFQELPGPGTIDLALGTPRFDVVPSGSTKLPAERRGWPPHAGLPELRQAVADRLRAEEGLVVNPSAEVFITHGASGAFSVVMDTFVNPGDRVVLFDPASPL